ncbi:TetR family transcriptional regulator [Nocardioides albertanoniae]|uniref:TetR family transcriptional regulator n=1 Tax=Nocardioides albertanoniae TaxID=1175486 RepID=A0A543ADK2_9ACTN|nr:TetR/AcrR family transcriptional regulator [Nocardioides albertanoniae]TQL70658.1 TetR family transcriptional regulator [Nocardioides albertanoniae]
MTDRELGNPKRTGRPRNSGRDSANPREEILKEASRLFTAQGVAATTISQIAESVGLRQSSMYYYYKSKEEILSTLMEKNRESLTLAEKLMEEDGPVAPRLYAFLYTDVRQLCTAPLDFYELEVAAQGQPQVFEGFDDDCDKLRAVSARLVELGVDSGELRETDPVDTALMLLSLNEGAQHRLWHGRREDEAAPTNSHALARSVADYHLSSLLADASTLAAVRDAGRAFVTEYEDDQPAA